MDLLKACRTGQNTEPPLAGTGPEAAKIGILKRRKQEVRSALAQAPQLMTTPPTTARGG